MSEKIGMKPSQVALLPAEWGQLNETSLKLSDQLTQDQWYIMGEKLALMKGSVHWWIGDWLVFGDAKYGDKQTEKEAERLSFEKGTLDNDKWIADCFEFSRRRENLSWGHHEAVAGFASDKQDYWLDEAEHNNWSRAQLRKAIREKRIQETPLPEGKYRVFYADPPWEYGVPQHSTEEQKTTLATHYPSMSIDQICGLDIPEMVSDDAVLFLWATSPLLFEAKKVIDAWGFTYKASIIWDKVKHNVGYYVSVRHEFLLIATKGNCLPDNPKLFDSVQSIERSEEHSEKPEKFREIIETIYTQGPYIELFGRKEHEGWMVWGNEI